jgi:hypothetical protein
LFASARVAVATTARLDARGALSVATREEMDAREVMVAIVRGVRAAWRCDDARGRYPPGSGSRRAARREISGQVRSAVTHRSDDDASRTQFPSRAPPATRTTELAAAATTTTTTRAS